MRRVRKFNEALNTGRFEQESEDAAKSITDEGFDTEYIYIPTRATHYVRVFKKEGGVDFGLKTPSFNIDDIREDLLVYLGWMTQELGYELQYIQILYQDSPSPRPDDPFNIQKLSMEQMEEGNFHKNIKSISFHFQ